MKSVSSVYLNISLLISAAVLIYLLGLVIFPTRSASNFPDAWEIITPEVCAGDALYHQVRFTKHVNRPGTVSIQIVDGYVITLPDQTSNLPKGDVAKMGAVTIPKSTPPGIYYLLITITYENNLVNKDIYVVRSQEFTVKNCE